MKNWNVSVSYRPNREQYKDWYSAQSRHETGYETGYRQQDNQNTGHHRPSPEQIGTVLIGAVPVLEAVPNRTANGLRLRDSLFIAVLFEPFRIVCREPGTVLFL